MKKASLTNHARRRIHERCSLSEAELRRILDADAGLPIHLQKGGRYVHRLIYSDKDEDWFMVVQDGGDGGVLTVMPLDYLQGRTSVTAAQKRQARKRARDAQLTTVEPALPTTSKTLAINPKPSEDSPEQTTNPPARALPGWKIRVRYSKQGKVCFKSLPRTLAEHGKPSSWSNPGPVHAWLKQRLIEAGIAFHEVDCFLVERKKEASVLASALLEHLPLTEEEIKNCR